MQKSAMSVPNNQRTGALKVENLKPGVQVYHFESRLLGRTFDSYGKASSATYKGGSIFVDHCSRFLHVEHQLGFSAVESIRAKQVYEQMAIHYGVVVESYLTDSGAFKANTLSNIFVNTSSGFVTVAPMLTTKMVLLSVLCNLCQTWLVL